MANLRDIRDRISSVKSTQQITRAMKMVAAARMRKAQERMMAARPYTRQLKETIQKLVERSEVKNPLFRESKEMPKVLVLVMGSDRGLCGGFNTNLFRVIEHNLHEHFDEHMKNKQLSMICFGKKANDFFKARKYPVIKDYVGFFDHLQYKQVQTVMDQIIDEFQQGEWDEVYLAYNEFKSVISQKKRFIKVLPVESPGEVVSSDKKAENSENNSKDLSDIDYLYEPDPEIILDYVLPLFVNVQMWQAALESYAAEQGARMTAMDSATENAGDIISDLQLAYNQARQSAITTEISEIVSGAEALSE
ncbi:ATP synthase F1 subunit gamma [Balneolaceae bacterium ANBcel3]|nr:ATP synthase F1 subunit gamma [Balneolaceae bacterium ANBcel3]